jgi:hypothetical protein
MIKMNKWTLGLAAVGLVTIPAAMQAQEKLSSLQTAVSSTTLSGYVDTSMQWAFNTAQNPPAYAYNNASKQDGFNLNVVNLKLEKPLDEKENWAAGYTAEMLYGPNAVGYNPSYVGAQNGDFGLKQAYVALRAPVGNGLDFKLGTFDSILGYEVYNSVSDPNYTRSWAWTFEPTQMTGLLTSYQITKEIGIAGGIADTANAGINNRAFLHPNAITGSAWDSTTYSYLGAITLTAPESFGALKGSTVYLAIVNGADTSYSVPSGYPDNKTWMYAGATLNTPLTGLKVGAAYDYIGGHGSPNGMTGAAGTTWANMASVYASYQASTHLSFHARGEYVWMQKGTVDRLDIAGGTVGADGTFVPANIAMADSMVAVTGTIQYDLWANVMSRLEFRWDHSATGASPFGNEAQNAFLLAANIIYKF